MRATVRQWKLIPRKLIPNAFGHFGMALQYETSHLTLEVRCFFSSLPPFKIAHEKHNASAKKKKKATKQPLFTYFK